jgi:2-hydroxychromene-2-carboxylate isomerase
LTTFYFDVGSPYAYLAAGRLHKVLPEPVHWQPVLLGGLFKLTGRSSWALGDYRRRQRGMAEIERRARGYGLPPIMWPDPWPSDYLAAMRAVTWAFGIGRGHELARQLFADGFQRGRELSIEAHVLSAASAIGLGRSAAHDAIRDPEIKRTLREATEAAHALGVFGVPTIAVGAGGLSAAPDGGALELFWGDDRLEGAAAYALSVGTAA